MNTITNTGSLIKPTFSSYQKFVVGILAFLQFTIILDFLRDAKANPDYRYRPDPSEALAVAKSLGLRNP